MPALYIKDSPRKRLGVILFILSPLAVLTLLCWWMYFALREPPKMAAKPIGAGAGHTGMSNEYMGLGNGRPAATGSTSPTGSPAH